MPTDELTALEAESTGPFEDKPPRSGLAAGVAILLALGALALSGLVWWEGRDLHPQDNSQLEATVEQLRQAQSRQTQGISDLASRLDDLAADGAGQKLENLESALSDQIVRNEELHSALETQQSYSRTLQQAIESVQARLMVVETGLAAKAPSGANSPDQFNLAGVDYLLRLAPERLVLFHDVRAADEALARADAQLAAMDNPVYLGLRQRITDARQALADTVLPDQVALSASLDSIQQQLAALTFGGEAVAVPLADSNDAETGWWQRLKASLAGLVTVRRNVDDADSRLTLEDKDLLRQGLWMQIEGARLALMRNDQASWQGTLTRAGDVLNRWFDTSSEAYASIDNQLKELSAISVAPVFPDISAPWAQLQLIRQASPIPVAPAANPADEPVAPAEGQPEEEELPVADNTESETESESESGSDGVDEGE